LSKAPWYFWVVAVLALVWNGFGGLDYVLTQTRNEAYLAMYTPVQRAYFDGLSALEQFGWGLGVWSSVAGSLLLALRSRLALPLFLASLAGIAIMLAFTFFLSDALKVMGPAAGVFSLAIAAVCLFLAWFSWVMRRREVLA
jgi:hypothetical protein